MSIYYEAKGVSFEQVKQDLEQNRLKGLSIVEVKEEDYGFEAKSHICITDGKDYVWLRPGSLLGSNSLGLKRWGRNNESHIIRILQTTCKIGFVSEEALDIVHVE